jgi:hypothetical protein
LLLARRFEALRRVLEDPMPYARRLARVLARAVRRFPEVALRFAIAPSRAAGFDPDDSRLGVEACACALGGVSAFCDTS